MLNKENAANTEYIPIKSQSITANIFNYLRAYLQLGDNILGFL